MPNNECPKFDCDSVMNSAEKRNNNNNNKIYIIIKDHVLESQLLRPHRSTIVGSLKLQIYFRIQNRRNGSCISKFLICINKSIETFHSKSVSSSILILAVWGQRCTAILLSLSRTPQRQATTLFLHYALM